MLPLDNDDDRLLDEAAERYLTDNCPASWARTARSLEDEGTGRVWRDLIDLGWVGLLLPEDRGGLGLGYAEAVILGYHLGKHLFPLPYGGSAILPALVHGRTEGFAEAIDAIVRGDMVLALADVTLRGPSVLIDHHSQATHVLALRDLDDGAMQAGILPVGALSLLPVDALDPCCPLAEWQETAAERTALDAALATTLSADDADAVRAGWRLYLLAELLGTARGGFELVLRYVQEREQFGVLIGSFQAIKHRFADMSMALDTADISLWNAAVQFDGGGDPAAVRRHLDFAHVAVMDAAAMVKKEVIQFHGAIGFTWECDAHLFQKRILRLGSLLPAEPAFEGIGRYFETAIAS